MSKTLILVCLLTVFTIQTEALYLSLPSLLNENDLIYHNVLYLKQDLKTEPWAQEINTYLPDADTRKYCCAPVLVCTSNWYDSSRNSFER